VTFCGLQVAGGIDIGNLIASRQFANREGGRLNLVAEPFKECASVLKLREAVDGEFAFGGLRLAA